MKMLIISFMMSCQPGYIPVDIVFIHPLIWENRTFYRSVLMNSLLIIREHIMKVSLNFRERLPV